MELTKDNIYYNWTTTNKDFELNCYNISNSLECNEQIITQLIKDYFTNQTITK